MTKEIQSKATTCSGLFDPQTTQLPSLAVRVSSRLEFFQHNTNLEISSLAFTPPFVHWSMIPFKRTSCVLFAGGPGACQYDKTSWNIH